MEERIKETVREEPVFVPLGNLNASRPDQNRIVVVHDYVLPVLETVSKSLGGVDNASN